MNKQNEKSLSGALNVLDALSKKKNINDYIQELGENEVDNKESNEELILINPNTITNWKFHDRPENEVGDINALAEDIKEIGQQQPCIVRPIKNFKDYKFELIVGERRWRAAKLANIKIKVIIKYNMSDSEAALSQASENNNRVNLSDYAKGMSFCRLINENIIKQKDLIEKLNKSKQYVSALLSFSKIPKEIQDEFTDMSKISAYTSESIVRLSKKGQNYIHEIIDLKDKICSGKIGFKKLTQTVEAKINKDLKKIPTITNTKYKTKSGQHLFTWRTDNNNLPSIHFPKSINDLFEKDEINRSEVSKEILNILEKKLSSL